MATRTGAESLRVTSPRFWCPGHSINGSLIDAAAGVARRLRRRRPGNTNPHGNAVSGVMNRDSGGRWGSLLDSPTSRVQLYVPIHVFAPGFHVFAPASAGHSFLGQCAHCGLTSSCATAAAVPLAAGFCATRWASPRFTLHLRRFSLEKAADYCATCGGGRKPQNGAPQAAPHPRLSVDSRQ